MRVLLPVLLCFCFCCASAQQAAISGTVTDGQGIPLRNVSVWVTETNSGTASNGLGYFSLNLKPGACHFVFRLAGYLPLKQTVVVSGDGQVLKVILTRTDNLTAQPAPADSIMRQAIARHKFNKHESAHYSGMLYTKTIQYITDIPMVFVHKKVADRLQMNTYGTGIISLDEWLSDFKVMKPGQVFEKVGAARATSNRDVFNLNGITGLNVDFYQENLLFASLCDHYFVSPLSSIALTYYRFTLMGRFKDGGQTIDEIWVEPAHRDEFLFKGSIDVVEGSWKLYAVNLLLGRTARIDLIDTIKIAQQFVPVGDSTWLPQTTVINFSGKMPTLGYGGKWMQVYTQLNRDTLSADTFKGEVYYSQKGNYQVPDSAWNKIRPVQLLPDEAGFYAGSESSASGRRPKTHTDSIQNTNNRFRLLPYLVDGYNLHNYAKNSSWGFQSPRSLYFYNTVEGWGIDLRPRYTKIYDNKHSLVIIPEVRYGFSDKVLNTNVFSRYVYNPFKQASIYARVGSDFLDLNNTGTISPFINSLSTLLLGDNLIKLYQSKFIMAGTDGEVANGILLNGAFEYAERTSLFNTTDHTFNKDSTLLTSNNPLDPNGNTQLFPNYRALVLKTSATFTFDQEYKITPAGKFIIPNPYPRVRINYRVGVPILGSDVNYSFLSVDVFQDRVPMGIWGYTAYFISTGRFLTARSLYYPDYKQFSGGQSFFFNAGLGSFHFLNFYTYSTDKPYFEAHVEHNFSGIVLSHVPLICRLNLQEIVGGSFLSQGTLPDYEEVYIGVKERFVRLDYGMAFGMYTTRVQGFRLIYNF